MGMLKVPAIIVMSEGKYQSQVAKEYGITYSFLNKIVKSHPDIFYIVKKGRNGYIQLTEKGKQIKPEMEKIWNNLR